MPECGTWKSLWRSKSMEPSSSFRQTPSFDRDNNPKIAAHRPPKETAGLRNAGVCAKGTKKESNTLDVGEFVRDVANRDYHYLYQTEVVRSGFIDIYPGQQIIGEEMQNAPQEETHGVLGNTLDAGALRSLNWPVEGPDLYACLEINPEQPKARNRLAHLDLKQPK